MQSIRYSCQILVKLELSLQRFEKCSNIKFHEAMFTGSLGVACRRTGRYDEANSRFYKILRKRLKMGAHQLNLG